MFLLQHPRGKGLGGVIGVHRHPRLPKDRAVIKVDRDLMHAAAMFCIAGIKASLMGVQAFVSWQKRGMNVQHTPLIMLYES